jgi:hypothetical protein
MSDDASLDDDQGRGKRVKKKRRLSANGEVDPTTVDNDGSPLKSVRRTAHSTYIAQPRDVFAADKAYATRLEANASKRPLDGMRSPCPVWANNRRALQAAVEYFRNPIRTEGGSVEVGTGGLARGVILEGTPPGQGTFWGQGNETGTIVACL